MTYVMIHGRGLSGLRAQHAVQSARVPSGLAGPLKVTIEHVDGVGAVGYVGQGGMNGLGVVSTGAGDRTVDGTTTGDREMMIAALSMQVAEWQKKMQDVLDGKLSWQGVLFRGPVFIKDTVQLRQFMKSSKDDLTARFLPLMAERLRDYTADTTFVMRQGKEYLNTVAAQFNATLDAEAAATLEGFAKVVKKETIKNANALLKAAKDAGEGAGQGVFPWWVAPVVGVVGVAYLWNTFRGR